MENNAAYLQMRGICKAFPGTIALDDVDFSVKSGEVHALLGENGAGKSTLMKILAGIYSKDKGTVIIDGNERHFHCAADAQHAGISFIHQELCLATNMKVYENVFMGRENDNESSPFIDIETMRKRTRKLLKYLDVDFTEDTNLSDLSIAHQQMVEIAKALSLDTTIMIMDEPTSSLSSKEVDMLFKVIKDLKNKGIAIIYISHRLEELYEVADKVTVMRDGQYVSTHDIPQTGQDTLIRNMVGRELNEFYSKDDHVKDEVILEVKDLSLKNTFHDVSFDLKKGEILGVAGLVGAGRSEIAKALFGVNKISSGTILINGKECVIKKVKDAFAYGILLVPEDRKKEGLMLDNTCAFNITLSSLDDYFGKLSFNYKKENEVIDNTFRSLRIKAFGPKQEVGRLSGGNQQKVVIGKILNARPKILILDEPTRGVDVGAKAEIYAIMNRLTEEGVSIIMISSDLPEIVNMSDRVMVVSEGTVAGILEKEEIEQEKIMYYATGGC